MDKKYSLLFPKGWDGFTDLDPVTMHDLGMDVLCKQITTKETEQKLLLRILSKFTADPEVAQYRIDVFDDLHHNRQMRERLMEILDRINFLRDYGSFKREYDESAGMWDLMHRLDEITDYIKCVDGIYDCLKEEEIHSQGLIGLREYVSRIHEESGFSEIRKDIESLRATTSTMKSVTVGINLNDRFEADGIGLISVNDRAFTKSTALNNFFEHVKDMNLNAKDWDGEYKFHPIKANGSMALDVAEQISFMSVAIANPILAGLARTPQGDTTGDITMYMDRVVNHMLSGMVKRLREVLNKYVTVNITDMTDLVPEFLFYIRFAEYMEGLMEKGVTFSKAKVFEASEGQQYMEAKGIFNIKLAALPATDRGEIVTNDLSFDEEHRIYILTGANRGGKTTITQAIGQLYVLAQAGLYIPGEAFRFLPVDRIYTHFPADEDQTMDLGRLGEECKRFRDMYAGCTEKSLLLLNETFSTTSFEEGYFIAVDSIRAIAKKGMRCIYNTHMHKLAFDLQKEERIHSLIVKSEEGKRSYKIEIAPPEGMSYANDIAKKYGVTFEQLTEMG